MHAFEESAQFDDKSNLQPVLSVVVIGRNEGQRLARCFESIARIENAAVTDVIYVDSASTDCSAELASRYGAFSITIHPERPTAAVARNTGWRVPHLILFSFSTETPYCTRNFPELHAMRCRWTNPLRLSGGTDARCTRSSRSSIEFSTWIGYIHRALLNFVAETCLCVALRLWRLEGLMTG